MAIASLRCGITRRYRHASFSKHVHF